MKIQIAIDFGTIEDAKAILRDVVDYVDIVEVGAISTEFGFEALKALKKEFPKPEYLSDIKIADGGSYFTEMAHRYGADYVTVLGAVEDETIKSAVKASKETGIKIVADMLGCHSFYERVKELDEIGVDYISVHTPADLQALHHTPFEHLKIARMLVKHAMLSVAGGIGPDNVDQVLPYKPEIIISGSALTNGSNRAENARRLIESIRKYEN